MKLFTVHDKATDTFSAPVTIPSTRDAIESFTASCNDPKSAHFKHSPDFTLFQIGEFDQFKGILTLSDKKLVANASSLIKHGEQYDQSPGTTL